jgi:hypothetical protein
MRVRVDTISIRLPEVLLDRIQAIIGWIGDQHHPIEVKRSAALRLILERGVEVMEREMQRHQHRAKVLASEQKRQKKQDGSGSV